MLAARRTGFVAALLILAACSSPETTELTGAAMGTTWTVTLAERIDAAGFASAESAVRRILAETDATLSTWNPDSELSSFNRGTATDWVSVSTSLYSVLEAAATVNRESGGAFDVTVGALVGLWGFGADAMPRRVPSGAAIAAARSLTGSDMLELRATPRAVRKRTPAVRIDVDAIAPGYAVDQISDELAALGYRNHIVEIGGEVRCRGRGPSGRSWRVAVERPQSGARAVQALVALEDLAISTSGDYRDFRVEDRWRISHTIDPRTGEPVAHALTSVSVVHESAMFADAYATALMVLGPEQGYALAQRLGVPALFIERANGQLAMRATASFARLQVTAPRLLHAAHN
jgi:thiamine biosynthesis lipoprotein